MRAIGLLFFKCSSIGDWGEVAERRVGPDRVVLLTPDADDGAGVA